jgi:hypothetical protein
MTDLQKSRRLAMGASAKEKYRLCLRTNYKTSRTSVVLRALIHEESFVDEVIKMQPYVTGECTLISKM